MEILRKILSIVFISTLILDFTSSLPLDETKETDLPNESASLDVLEGSGIIQHTNKSQSLYVVKAVVYEIGILTDDDDDDDNSTSSEETHERVDLTFFDAHRNSSHINLGNIPLPVQTNVSGQVLTGIAPVNIGAFSNPADLLSTLPLTGTIVNITHSDTAYFKLSTKNASEGLEGINQSLPEGLLRVPQPIDQRDEED